MASDLLGVDFDSLEERLVEEPPLGRLSSEVGSLRAIGELEGIVEHRQKLVVVELMTLEQLLGGGAFALDPLLLLVEEIR